MIAKDIMTRDVITVKASDNVEDVAKLMVDNKISGIPVVDENDHVIGIVTEQDLMVKASDLKVPFYITLFDSIIFLENPMKFNDNFRKYTAVKVKDIMTTKVSVVPEDTEIPEIVKIMTKNEINRVPVERHNKIVGIITRNDILKSLVAHHE
ncbi:MAG: CBS domain-containing protein [Candidatus Saccharibacteria bacterium]